MSDISVNINTKFTDIDYLVIIIIIASACAIGMLFIVDVEKSHLGHMLYESPINEKHHQQ